jgi:glycosyltransferase involved in cell wall biosynthesis
MFKHDVQVIQIPNFIEIPEQAERQPKNYFLFIGRITAKKALDNLIEALAKSTKFLESDFVLKIAGRGDEKYMTDIRKLIEKLGLSQKIELIGQVEGEEKQKLYANAYWTFMPSHTENFGMVVLESLAQSTPVLASTGSPWKSLEDERVGFWCDNSPDVLARKIEKILTMAGEEYHDYRARGRRFVIENFDVRRNSEVWSEFYSSL